MPSKKRKYLSVLNEPFLHQNGFQVSLFAQKGSLCFDEKEPVVFDLEVVGKITAEDEVYAYFKWNSEKIIWHEVISVFEGKGQIRFEEPWVGFGHLHVLMRKKGVEVWEVIRGIAKAPETLTPSWPCPDDFDLFWQNKKNSAQMIETYSCQKINLKDSMENDVEVFDVGVETTVGKLAGLLSKPKKCSKDGLPVVLYLHGAGVRSCDPYRFLEKASQGYLIFEMNAHGILNLQDEDYYQELENGTLKNYHEIGRHSLEACYFVNMFLRVKCALQYLMGLAEWDQVNLISMGGSQGAAQAYAGAYLEPKVTSVIAGIPAYGDLTGFLKGRRVNFSDWLCFQERGYVDQGVFKVAPYLDAVNFLKNYHHQLCVCFGLLDQGCSPLTNYVPIANCPADATIILQGDVYHRICPEADDLQWSYLSENLLMKTYI